MRDDVSVEAVWPMFEQKARAKNIDPTRFAERLTARESHYKQRWDRELSDLEPDLAPFTQVIRQLRRRLRGYA